jgi:hypothetical protein
MSYMTDTGRSAALLNYAYAGSSAPTINGVYNLRLMSAQATGNGNVNGTNGTELANGNGYTSLGNSMNPSGYAFNTFSSTTATATNINAVTWNSITGSWSTVVAIEIWDNTSPTKLRWMQGQITNITGVASGDVVEFPAGSITANAAAW